MRSTRCFICQSDNLLSINKQIAEGRGLAALARSFKVPYHSLWAHAQNHARRQVDVTQFNTIDYDINKGRLETMLKKSIKAGHHSVALKVLAEIRQSTDQFMKYNTAKLQARIRELESENASLKSHGYDTQSDDNIAELIKVFTTAELRMFKRIQAKFSSQDPKDIIIPDETSPWDKVAPKRINGSGIGRMKH